MANLFANDFESGTIIWDWSDTDGGDVSVTTGAKLHGTYGLNVLINDNNAKYVQDDLATPATRYRFRLYFDVNSLTMAANDETLIFEAQNSSYGAIWMLILKYESSAYKLYVQDSCDGTWASATAKYTITDAPHCVEVDWKAATSAGANNGFIELLIDGVSKETKTGINSDTESVSHAQVGAMEVDTGTRGTIYFDDFASNNDGSAIGVISTNINGTFSLSGKGNLSATAIKGGKGSFSLSGKGNTTSTAKKGGLGSFLLEGKGNNAFTGIKKALVSFLLSGKGTTIFIGLKKGISSFLLSGKGTTNVTGKKGGKGSFTISGKGNTAFSGIKKAIGSFLLSGKGNTIFTGFATVVDIIIHKIGSFILSGGGNTTFSGKKKGIGILSLSGKGSQTFTGAKGALGIFLLSGKGNQTFMGVFYHSDRYGTFILSGGGDLVFIGKRRISIPNDPATVQFMQELDTVIGSYTIGDG